MKDTETKTIDSQNNTEAETLKEEEIKGDDNKLPDSPLKDKDSKQKAKLNHYQKKRLRKRRKLDAVKRWFKVNEREIHSAVTAGFEYATAHGPLFGETILGACFVIDELEVIDPSAKQFLISHKQEFENPKAIDDVAKNKEATDDAEEKVEETKSASGEGLSQKDQQLSVGAYTDTYGPITGQIMSMTSKLCKKAFLNAEPRVVEGMYKCELQVSSENLGKIYDVIRKNRARTLEEELQESSEMFMLKILVPVYDSFTFSDQIRDRECGIPHPQLIFYGWEINDMDPFHVAMTDEELEEFGDQELPPNQVKLVIDKIRKRKGLPTEKKLVEDGSKQSTLSKKK